MAGNINTVILQGRLTSDPELRYTPGGTAVCDLRLASNRYYRDGNDERQEETLFATVTAWGRQAENCSEYLSKGSPVIIQGRLQLDQWETEEGENRSKMKIVANNVQFLSGGPGSDQQGQPAQAQASRTPKEATVNESADNNSGGDDGEFDDIPF